MRKQFFISDLPAHSGDTLMLCGWAFSIRNMGSILFFDLRDSTGIVQVVVPEGVVHEGLTMESVVEVVGVVQERGRIKEGALSVEVVASEVRILSGSDALPFPVSGDGYELDDALRLRYRYLDLRRERLQKNIQMRSDVVHRIREYLHINGFCEIETPLLSRTTPEGSRDFVVPSRLQKGKFYALPQSPQQYKQLLMVAGFEKYFQIARCLRDEDLRKDRSFEHTQVDIELSFTDEEGVMSLIEEMIITLMNGIGKTLKAQPFPRYTYAEAMEQFGADKFDLRTEDEKSQGVLAFAWVVRFPFFERNAEGQWTFSHNPFSDPIQEHKSAFLNGEIEGIHAAQYDLVCNGFEVGGGSIRSNDPRILSRVFEVMGYDSDRIDADFGHMLSAFRFGVPPHGGIALGIDRLLTLIQGEESIREVIAFPMSYSGNTSVMDAPTALTPTQLADFGISLSP